MSLDARMTETLPPPTVALPNRDRLTALAREVIKRDDRHIERLALVLAMRALQHIQDMPADEVVEAMDINACAMRRAAELLDERARLIQKGGKRT